MDENTTGQGSGKPTYSTIASLGSSSGLPTASQAHKRSKGASDTANERTHPAYNRPGTSAHTSIGRGGAFKRRGDDVDQLYDTSRASHTDSDSRRGAPNRLPEETDPYRGDHRTSAMNVPPPSASAMNVPPPSASASIGRGGYQQSSTNYRGGHRQADGDGHDTSQRSSINYRGGHRQPCGDGHDTSQRSSINYRGGHRQPGGDSHDTSQQSSVSTYSGERKQPSEERSQTNVSQRSSSNQWISGRGGLKNVPSNNVQRNVAPIPSVIDGGGRALQPSGGDVHRSLKPTQAPPPATDESQKQTKSVSKRQIPIFLRGRIPSVSYVDNVIANQHVKAMVSRYVRAKAASSLFASSQPVPIKKGDGKGSYKQLSDRPYNVTWKSDGERCLVLIEDKGRVWLVDSNDNVFTVKQLSFPTSRNEPIKNTLLEAEVVIDKHEDREIPRMLITDVITFQDKNLGDMPLLMRSKLIEQKIVQPRRALKRDDECMGVRRKEWYSIQAARFSKIFNPEFQKKVPHRIESLLFKPCNESYASGHVLEWKPQVAKSDSLDDAQAIRQITWTELDDYIAAIPSVRKGN